MSWRFEILESAKPDFEKLDSYLADRVREKLEWFVGHFEEQRPFALSGEFRSSFKLRVGDWRIVYEVGNQEQVVYVVAIEHRSKV